MTKDKYVSDKNSWSKRHFIHRRQMEETDERDYRTTDLSGRLRERERERMSERRSDERDRGIERRKYDRDRQPIDSRREDRRRYHYDNEDGKESLSTRRSYLRYDDTRNICATRSQKSRYGQTSRGSFPKNHASNPGIVTTIRDNGDNIQRRSCAEKRYDNKYNSRQPRPIRSDSV